MRALIRKLRDAPYGVVQFAFLEQSISQVVMSFGLFRNSGSEQTIFKFLNSAANVEYRRNMGIVKNPMCPNFQARVA